MNPQATISTIILNWNRADCLKTTVESYLATVSGPYELMVVDNASTDGSVAYLREVEKTGQVRVVLLDENIGGLAYNGMFELCRGELLHLSENDQLFLPGWAEHVRESFEVFPDLGQLSLFSDVPTDYEAWGAKPAKMRFAKGKILYEAQYNLTTSCIMRGSLITERGIRVTNLEGLDYKFPADAKLSADVKESGFFCAWSDRYYVRNLGHEAGEFEANDEYYRANYASKPWVGVAGWQARMDAHRAQPKFVRESALFPERHAGAEKTEQPVQGKVSRLWSRFDSKTPEVEVLDFIHALVRLVKPAMALESNTWLGLTTCAIAMAQRANGFGHLTTLEADPDALAAGMRSIAGYGLEAHVTAIGGANPTPPADQRFDFVVYNSSVAHQIEDMIRLREQLAPGCVVVICEAADHIPRNPEAIQSLLDRKLLTGMTLPTPRGVFVGRTPLTGG